MHAIVVRAGGALSFEDVPAPGGGPGRVVVELRAAAVNRRDLLVRNPPGPAYVFPLPLIPGSDGAGVRRDTGRRSSSTRDSAGANAKMPPARTGVSWAAPTTGRTRARGG